MGRDFHRGLGSLQRWVIPTNGTDVDDVANASAKKEFVKSEFFLLTAAAASINVGKRAAMTFEARLQYHKRRYGCESEWVRAALFF